MQNLCLFFSYKRNTWCNIDLYFVIFHIFEWKHNNFLCYVRHEEHNSQFEIYFRDEARRFVFWLLHSSSLWHSTLLACLPNWFEWWNILQISVEVSIKLGSILLRPYFIVSYLCLLVFDSLKFPGVHCR